MIPRACSLALAAGAALLAACGSDEPATANRADACVKAWAAPANREARGYLNRGLVLDYSDAAQGVKQAAARIASVDGQCVLTAGREPALFERRDGRWVGREVGLNPKTKALADRVEQAADAVDGKVKVVLDALESRKDPAAGSFEPG